MDNTLHPPLQPQLTIFFPYNNIHMMSIFPSFFHTLLSLWSLASCVCVPSRSVMSDSLRPDGPWPVRFLCPRDFPGKNTGVGCHFLLQRVFPTYGLNLRLLHLLPSLPPGVGYCACKLSLFFFFLTNSHSSLKSYLVCSSLPEGFPDFLEDIRSSCSEPLVSAFIILVIFSKALSSVCGRWGR